MIDDIDLKIVNILQQKARIPNVEVARQVGMAPSAVLERIRKLEKQGYIDGYEVRLNPKRFNRSQVVFMMVGIVLTMAESAAAALAAIDQVQEVHLVSSADALLVKLRVADTDQLGQLIKNAIAPINGVCTTQSMVVMQTAKETAQFAIETL
jgi:Lrp/AsnC family leucine-responsive transcriptional regulator